MKRSLDHSGSDDDERPAKAPRSEDDEDEQMAEEEEDESDAHSALALVSLAGGSTASRARKLYQVLGVAPPHGPPQFGLRSPIENLGRSQRSGRVHGQCPSDQFLHHARTNAARCVPGCSSAIPRSRALAYAGRRAAAQGGRGVPAGGEHCALTFEFPSLPPLILCGFSYVGRL
jgi:hypothetical protein